MMTSVEILEAAAGEVDRGWCQYQSRVQSDDGQVTAHCLAGAVHQVTHGWTRSHGSPEHIAAMEALGLVSEYLGLRPSHELVEWNDRPGRTQHEVSGLLRAVADKIR